MILLNAVAATGYSNAIYAGPGEYVIEAEISETQTLILKMAPMTESPDTTGSNYAEVDSASNTTTFTASGKIGRKIEGPVWLSGHCSAYTSGAGTLKVTPLDPKTRFYDTKQAVS